MGGWQVPGYAEESELGRGGSGRVVAAVERATGERVAVKYLADRLVTDEQFRAAFRGEAEILARLNLPHVARVRGYVESAQGAAIIMDLAGGAALRQILARFGPTSPPAALSVLKGSLLGLAGAHRAGIVHRDYKPENVMVDQAGSSMLVDFGIALRAGAPGEPAGTPGYAAPEQWQSAPASPAGDIYAAAVTFTECVTGAPPPRGPLPPAFQAGAAGAEVLGPGLAAVIARATAADPAARPADAAALLAELQESADERYGAGWEETGRADLARGVAALLALAGGVAAGAAMSGGPPGAGSAAPAHGPTARAATVLRPARRVGRAARARAGHGPAVIISAAAAIGIAAVAAVAVALATHHHGPGQFPRGTQLVAQTVHVTACRTNYGLLQRPPARYPRAIGIRLPAAAAGRLGLYSDSIRSVPPILAPRGWACSAVVGADGSTSIAVFPRGSSASSPDQVVAYDDSVCQGCIFSTLCPLITYAAADFSYGTCATHPARETVTWLARSSATARPTSGAISFVDPPGTKGDGTPSGGAYYARGVLLFTLPTKTGPFDRASIITCTLPTADRSLCAAILDAFRQQNWPHG